ncbi:MAG: hypothetical protein Q9166_002053 [cf. Caloplaca sp. 2 TL-2023]
MHSSSLLVVSLVPFLAFAAPQGGIFPAASDLSTANATPSSTITATATITGTGASKSTSILGPYPTLGSWNGTASSSSIAPADISIANDVRIIGQLVLAAKAVDRINMIPQDTSFKFDFDNPPEKTKSEGKGGHTIRADRQSFPPLVVTGISMTLGFLGPCGFNTPHTHPRSSEINVVVQGSLQNGGALHTEFNPNCDDAIFVAGFASEDPGAQQVAQSYFGFDQDVVEAATGNDFTFEGKDVDTFRSLIPANVALGVESCLKKCGIN